MNKPGDKIRQGMLYLRLQSCSKAVQEELLETRMFGCAEV
jgi:hypothetical protein